MSGQGIHVGVIVGNDGDRTMVQDATQRVAMRGNNDANLLISLIGKPEIFWTRIHLTPSFFRKPFRVDLSSVDVLWNLISDADQHPDLLAVADRFVRDFPGAVIDAPSEVRRTRRHQVAARLQNLPGVHMPKTLLVRNPTRERLGRQIEAEGFRFPAILRTTGAHNGEVLCVAQTLDECSSIFGDRKREYYLTEFIDVRGPDGLYRKSRFIVVGDRIVVRQHIVAKTWNIHGASSRAFMVTQPDLLEEARGVLQGQFSGLPALTQGALEAIRDAMCMDYFGVDACIRPDGSLTVFEANATMNFNPAFRNPATQYNRAALPPTLEATERLLVRRSAERRGLVARKASGGSAGTG